MKRQTCLIGIALLFAVAALSFAAGDSANSKLFPTNLPSVEWTEFKAAGFTQPVAGMIFTLDRQPCCGVSIGGVGTQCFDIDTNGTIGFNNVFQNYPRKAKHFAPFLGISVGGKTWVLSSQKIIDGGKLVGCIEPGTDPWNKKPDWSRVVPKQEGVEAAREIHYFGHYPVADLEYDTDSPVSVGLRAWAPFIPGDAHASNIPGAIFEVRLRNTTKKAQKGTIAFSYPGMTAKEAGSEQFERKDVQGSVNGVMISGQRANYAVGVVGEDKPRMGADLSSVGTAWAQIAKSLPVARPNQSGASLAVDFSLKQSEERIVRFVLAWYVPIWGDSNYHTMYSAKYNNSLEALTDLARNHETLLRRVLGWQQAIYMEKSLPVWLRESLVNNLCLIAEDSYWAQSKSPLDWGGPDGVYGMIECPRACPQIECIPCSWYGNMPIVYFFPALAHSTIKGYKQYQALNGAPPFCFGGREEFFAGGNAWQNQISLNGVCYVDMVDRMWQRTGDDAILKEFYDSVKKSTTLTALMGEPPANVISMPCGDGQTEWWEGWPWTGMTPHVGGMHLSNMAIAKRMAEKMGDTAYAKQCEEWLSQGQKDMEERMWNNDSYLLMFNLNTGKRDDRVMANQLDAEWAQAYHGMPGVFRPDRVKTVLATVKKYCMVDTGAVSFSSRKGEPELTTYGIFIPEIMILGMTYIYNGDRETGLDAVRRMMDASVRKQLMGWDMTNQIRADTGARTFGTDYYQDMMLWALPTALEGRTLGNACSEGSLVDKVLKAAK